MITPTGIAIKIYKHNNKNNCVLYNIVAFSYQEHEKNTTKTRKRAAANT